MERGSDDSSSDENDDEDGKTETKPENEQETESKGDDVAPTHDATQEKPKTPEPNEQEIAAADAEVSEIITASEQEEISSVPTAEQEAPKVEEQPVVQPEEEEDEEEVEEEEEEDDEPMNPEVVPGLENAVWDKIKDEDWEFEYEPLVTPWGSQRSSKVDEPSEMAKTVEWLHEKKETRGANILARLCDRAEPIGGTVKLTTTVDGNGVRVNWKKDGEYVERSSKLTVSIIPPMFILTISDLDKKDEGIYTAEIVQGKTKMETSAKVTVLNIRKEKKVKPFGVRIRGRC